MKKVLNLADFLFVCGRKGDSMVKVLYVSGISKNFLFSLFETVALYFLLANFIVTLDFYLKQNGVYLGWERKCNEVEK